MGDIMPRPKYTEQQRRAAAKLRRLWEKEWLKKYNEHNQEKRLLWAARARAKRKGIECTITEADTKIPKVCPYLGVTLIRSLPRGSKRGPIATLDRIDNSKGYTPDNIEVISWQANTMKTNATIEELVLS